MDKREQVMVKLMAGWNGQVLGGLMTYEDLCDSLLDQITGAVDMSSDELDDEMAILMGWDPSAITEDQYKVWRDLVNETANKYMYGHKPEPMTIDKVKGMLLARGWDLIGAEIILEDVEDMKEEDRTEANILRLIEDYEDR